MTSTTSLVPATQTSEPALLKADVMGQTKRTREQRERILDAQRSERAEIRRVMRHELSNLCQLGAVPQGAHQLLLLLDNFFAGS
jgi:hypothetical protein